MPFLICLLLAAPAATGEKPGLAMMDMKAVHGVPESLAQVLNESFLVALKDSGKLGNIVGGSDLRAMLDLEQQKTALGCADDSCLAELGGALGVPYLFTASLAKVGKSFVMHTKLVSVEDAKVLSRGMKTVKSEDDLLALPKLLVDEALTVIPSQEPTAVSAPKTGAVAAEASSKPINWLRWTGLGLSVIGASVAEAGYSTARAAQGTYDELGDAATSTDFNKLNGKVEDANLLWLGGLSGAAVGIVLAVLAP